MKGLTIANEDQRKLRKSEETLKKFQKIKWFILSSIVNATGILISPCFKLKQN